MRLEVTDDCHLRSLEEADAEELYGLVEANRSYLAEWMPWAAGQTLKATAEFIRKTRKQLEDNDGLQGALVLGGQIVGAGGLLGVEWEARKTGIGYWPPPLPRASGRPPRASTRRGTALSLAEARR